MSAWRDHLRRAYALTGKETRQIVRDPSSILIAFVLPAILLFLFGYGVSLDAQRVPVGLVLEDSSSTAASLAQSFAGTSYITPRIARCRQEIENDIVAGRLRGMVVIPADFDKQLQTDDSASIQIIADGSEPGLAGFVQNYGAAIASTWMLQRHREKASQPRATINLQERVWYNPERESRRFLIPGSITIIMTVIGTLLTALVVAREWERGTMEALLATPVGVPELVLGKLIPYFLLGMGSMALCTLVAVSVFDVPFRGSFLALAGLTALFLIAALGQGLLISTLLRNQLAAAQAAMASAYLPAVMLSGFIFEIGSMPAWIRGISTILPARHFTTSLTTLFLTGSIPGLLWKCAGAMALIAFIFMLLVFRKTRKKLD